MGKLFKNLGIILIISICVYSCKKDDVYRDLSENAKGFLLYEVGDTFQLKNVLLDEIITLTVTSKEIGYSQNPSGPSSLVYFGPNNDVFYERGEYFFTDASNCYIGSIIVIAVKDEDFVLQGVLGNCFGDINEVFYSRNEIGQTIDFEGLEYSNAFLMRSNPYAMYYSKQKGILKIENEFTQETLFTFVE